MSGIFNKTCQYAVQATIYLARQPEDKLVRQLEIANELKVPHHFLGKILQSLSRTGLIYSVKGKNGGFKLGKPPGKITILEIIRSIEGPMFLEGCFLGLPGCGDKKPCAAHKQWKIIKTRLLKLLDKNLTAFCTGFDEKLKIIKKRK